jgi:hypothetical protein
MSASNFIHNWIVLTFSSYESIPLIGIIHSCESEVLDKFATLGLAILGRVSKI